MYKFETIIKLFENYAKRFSFNVEDPDYVDYYSFESFNLFCKAAVDAGILSCFDDNLLFLNRSKENIELLASLCLKFCCNQELVCDVLQLTDNEVIPFVYSIVTHDSYVLFNENDKVQEPLKLTRARDKFNS